MNKDLKYICDIPKTTGIYKELLDVDNIIVTRDGKVINTDTNKEITVHEHERYYSVSINSKTYYIHRLVALLYVENILNEHVVFHINKNTLDNRYTNLAWTNQSFVSRTRKDFKKDNKDRKVALIDDDMNILKIYENGGCAARDLNLNRSEVYRVCKGKRNHVGGYKFKYEDEM